MQVLERPRVGATQTARGMTKLPGSAAAPGQAACTTTLINRSGQCYQLHRPHLAAELQQCSLGLQVSDDQQPPLKKLRADEPALSAKQQQQKQQALATEVLLRGRNDVRAPAQQLASSQPGAQSGARRAGSPRRDDQQRPDSQQQRGGTRPNSALLGRQAQPRERQPPVSTHVSSLYPEILAQIFGHLSVRDRGRCAQVCAAWREAAYQRSAWRGVQARLHLRRHSAALLGCLERRGIARVQVLSLSARRGGLAEVLRGLPRLRSLDLSGCYHMTDAGLAAAVAPGYQHLAELDLSNCKNLTDAGLGAVARQLPNLRALLLGGCGALSNQGLAALARGLRGLRHLDLRSCWLLSDAGIGQLAPLPLERLGLQDCQRVSDEALRLLPGSLRALNLSFCVLVSDQGLKHLARLPGLRELDLRSCDNVSEAGVGFLAEGGAPLAALDLSFCDKINDQALQHISQALFQLRSLSLAACPISDEGLCLVAKTQHELETLHVGQCSRLTDRSLQACTEHLRRLRHIDLYGCTKLSRQAIDNFEMRAVAVNRDLWQERRR